MANALNDPKRRRDGKSEKSGTANPQASTTEVSSPRSKKRDTGA
jgi:hypothetical protein